MAKRKDKSTDEVAVDTHPLVMNTAELMGDGANPRKISDEAKDGLRASIKRFGDLSGIVFNKRTGELVAGHQRMEQIRAEYGDREIEPIDAAAGLSGIRIDADHYFPVRVVDWTQAKQRAANVAANNQKLQGKFTSDLSTYLLSVEAELTAEMPGVLDECLMLELMAAGIDTSDASQVPAKYQVIVECASEEEQKQLYERFTAEGLTVKLLTF